MSAIALRRRLVRCRRHLIAMTAVVVLGAAIFLHHSGVEIGGAHAQHDGMSAAIEMCLGALTAVGITVAAVAVGVLALGRWRPVRLLTPAGLLLAARPPIARARAGPPLLCLLCVSRR